MLIILNIVKYFLADEGGYLYMSDKKSKNVVGLKLIACKTFTKYSEMYKVVDFLNKSLKDKNIIFGLTKKGDKMTINIYQSY
jgi:hypothetical protein